MQSLPPYYQQQQGYQPQPYQPQPPAPNVLNNGPSLLNHPNGLPPMQHPGIPDQSQVPTGGQPAPKRKQVKNACTNCQKACKKCDDARPCPRCIKYGIADTCVNSVRKERKKGIKRGPYKRRQKTGEEKPRKNAAELSNTDQQPAQYAPVRGPTMTYGYPSNLNQYGQPFEMSYGQYYQKEHMMSQPYVVNPVYPPMGYPVIVSGGDGQPQQQPGQPGQPGQPQQHAYHPQYSMIHQQAQQQQQQQQAQQQQQQQQQQQAPQQTSASSSPRPPMMQQHNEHVMHQASPAGSPQVYYQQAAVAAAAAAQPQAPPPTQQHSQPPSQRNSPHLPEIKADHASNEGFAKPQSMTPVPSTSTSTATTSSPDSGSWVPPRSS